MPIAACPHCRQAVNVSPDHFDQLLLCPKCRKQFRFSNPVQAVPSATPGPEPPPPLPQRSRRRESDPVAEMLPDEVYDVLRRDENEKAIDFAWVDIRGGCLDTSAASRWILITDKRVVYEASVSEGKAWRTAAGSFPISRISFVGTSAGLKPAEGCNPTVKVSILEIGSGGGHVDIVVPNVQVARRLQRVIDRLISHESH